MTRFSFFYDVNKLKLPFCLWVLTVFLQSCGFTRTMVYWKPNITDHKIFRHVDISPGDSVFHFQEGNKEIIGKRAIVDSRKKFRDTLTFDNYLAQRTTTTAFLVIRNDSVLFENYYKGYIRDSISTIFSVSKSVTSLLAGIAVDEGYIESVNDPVTKYVPELKEANPKFDKLTIEHLLDMRAGFKFNEDNLVPFSKATNLYYGTNHLNRIKKVKFKHEPGEVHEYQSMVTALLGVVIERAIGRNLAEYLQEKVWNPVGMENRATWSIDGKKHHSAKAHVGLNTTAIDLAKIGRLYLNNGNWNGKQIVSPGWVARSITPNPAQPGYQYHWYTYGDLIPNPQGDAQKYSYACFPDSLSAANFATKEYPDNKCVEVAPTDKNKKDWSLCIYPEEQAQFAAEGIMNQWIYVDPRKNVIIVRLGEKEDVSYHFIRSLISSL